MAELNIDWKETAKNETQQRINAEKVLEEMQRFLFDYFHLLGPDPRQNMSIVVETLGKVLGSTVALYNRMDSGLLKTWCIDHEPEGFKREDDPDGHICYDMTIRQRGHNNMTAVVLNNLEGTEWENLDSNVAQYGLKSYLGFPVLVERNVVGSLCVVDVEKRQFTDVEKYIIEAFASAIRLEEERLLTQTRLESAYQDLESKNKEIETLALTDTLTKLPNRRAMIDTLNSSLSTLQRKLFKEENKPGFIGFSLALCDVDHFKSINDTYGHNCGDEVLATIADILSMEVRPNDHVARWGGEEFLILFPETDTENAVTVAERLRKKVAQHNFSFKDHKFNLTITIGISTCASDEMSLDDCVHLADLALYKGKESGRNKVITSAANDHRRVL